VEQDLAQGLKLLSAEGWRLASTIPGPLETILVFERPDPTEKAE
jgi:hypothetical protein